MYQTRKACDEAGIKPFSGDEIDLFMNAIHGETYGHTTEQMHQEAAERFQASISERLSSQSF